MNPNELTKALTLGKYALPGIFQLKFSSQDKFHSGTIKQWIEADAAPLSSDYVKSSQVMQLLEGKSLVIWAHLVIIIGSRHILLWDMDKDGNLVDKPCLVGVARTRDK